MKPPKRKPTRRDLLVIIGRLQQKFGRISAANNDRNPNRDAEVGGVAAEGLNLCIEARGYDPPLDSRLGPWGQEAPPKHYS